MVRSVQIPDILKEKIIGFAEGSDMGNGSKRGTKDNSKAFDLNIWKDKVPIYETGETVVGAALQSELDFGFGCVKFVS